MTPPAGDFTMRKDPPSPYRADAPPDRAIFTVLGPSAANREAPTILHDHIGETIEREVDESGRAEVAALLGCGRAPGTYVWEGTVTYSRCGSYDCPDYEMDLTGETRPATFEEAQAVASDEYPWDRALWLTAATLEEEAALRVQAREVEKARSHLEDVAFAWIKHTARVPSSNVAAAVFLAAKRLYREIEDPI